MGFDITMPHKSDIIPLCDEVEPFSREFNCVNHVKIRDGKLIGVGLDGLGMVMAIEDSGFPIYGSKVLSWRWSGLRSYRSRVMPAGCILCGHSEPHCI